MKRIFLLIATNFAVMALLSIVVSVLGLDRVMGQYGYNLPQLLVMCSVFGFGGAFVSLLMSKTIAKWSTGAQVIDSPRNADEAWLIATVQKIAQKAGVAMPEVAIYDGAPNAFATGAFKNSALVAVSTGLLTGMNREQIEGVLGHELSHVANGDMVTLTLIQGVLNTFVMFLARVVGFFIDRVVFRNDRGTGMGFYLTVMACQLVFGLLASIIVSWFSRYREFRADAGSAKVLGTPGPMINALTRLQSMEAGELPKPLSAFGIGGGLGGLFASHPPLEERIRALQTAKAG
jgi:heat shock protein HtpX